MEVMENICNLLRVRVNKSAGLRLEKSFILIISTEDPALLVANKIHVE